MARDISRRLTTLKARRSGTDRLNKISTSDQSPILEKSYIQESYQKRAPSKPYTSYALGAMQEVGAEYTRISIETAERVRSQLAAGLTAEGFRVDFRLQGSVPCNIHIRGVSDVDLLTLDDAFHTYDSNGPKAIARQYTTPVNYTPVSALLSLRSKIEKILREKYPKTDVDTSGNKAVKISGGSLARPVDIVASHWHDTPDYQRTGQEIDRGVRVLDKSIPKTLDNMPFRHIDRINKQDKATSFSLKKAIRLCKNVKSDASEEGTKITLPSFDIASVMYHANAAALSMGASFDLAILAEAQRHLDALTTNEEFAKTLKVPDGSRCIFDSPEKLKGLRLLSIELDDLLLEVVKEQDRTSDGTLSSSRSIVSSIYIPNV